MFVQISFNCEFKHGQSWLSDWYDSVWADMAPAPQLVSNRLYMVAQVAVRDIGTNLLIEECGHLTSYIPITKLEDIARVTEAFTVTFEQIRTLVESDRIPLGAAKRLEEEIRAIERMTCPRLGMYPLPKTAVTTNLDLVVSCNYLPIRQFTCIVDVS